MSSVGRLLLFVHVPKAGGSTIRSIISRNYSNGARVAFDEWQDVDFRKIASSESTRLIIGHFRFGMHFGIMRPISYCAMLRDPVERYVSDYFYAYSSPSHRLREAITSGRLTLEQFLLNADPVALVRQLTGLDDPRVLREPDLAERIVASSYSMLGISERFDESVLLLAHVNGWAPPIYIPKNKTRLSADLSERREQSKTELAPAVSSRFERDLAFYKFCCDRLDQSITMAGRDFKTALEAFRSVQEDIIDTANSLDLDEMYFQADFRTENKLPKFVDRILDSREYRIVEEFVKSDTPLKRRPVRLLHAGIDRVQNGRVKGWALKDGTSDPISISVRADGADPRQVVAKLDRPDLGAAGFSSTAHGYEVDVGRDVNDPNAISVAFNPLKMQLARPSMMDRKAQRAS